MHSLTDAVTGQTASFARELEVAQSAAHDATEVLCRYFRNPSLETTAKRYLDVVTQADTESEMLLVSRVNQAFPDDAMVGEEGTNTQSSNGRAWHIDPLDGTYNFSRGLPFWCVSVGLAVNGIPVMGVVFDPLLNEMFTGSLGGGSYVNDQLLHASDVTDPMEATLHLSINYDREVIEQSLRDLNAVARGVMRTRNLGALALEIAYVAAGRLDAVAQRGSHSWDYAAAALIAREASAVVTNLAGKDFDLASDNALVAATPALHSELLRLLEAQ